MVSPQAHDSAGVVRHPSQLYQAFGEGLLLFIILWFYARKPRATGQISGVFMMGYGVFRFIAEYFREPDDFLGLRALNWSQGQWLSLPMILAGAAIFAWATKRNQRAA
jgi:phosphatidylglycerol:prolipoprotein diacylglycerol transferase